MSRGYRVARRALAVVSIPPLLAALVSAAGACGVPTMLPMAAVHAQDQTRPETPATPAQVEVQTGEGKEMGSQVASAPASDPATAKPAAEPLYREYKGVTIGMSAADVRARLGNPKEKSDEMDFFIFSDRERARVYYRDGTANAVIATYIGKDAGAPEPSAVLGAEIEPKPDGSMYRMTTYPQAGYWVAYSRTPGDAPLVIITMQSSR